MKRCTEMEGSEERSGGNQVTFNSTSEALRHARVEFDDKRISVIDISMQSYVILDTVKICSKTDIEKIEKKNILYSPGVSEDDRVGISKGSNRVAK